jgi:hypothetical protein
MTKSNFSAKEKDTVAEADELWEGEGATPPVQNDLNIILRQNIIKTG